MLARVRKLLIWPDRAIAARRMPSATRLALDDPPSRDEAAVGVEEEDAHDDADPERQDDDDEVLRLQAEGRLGEARPEDAEDADQRRRRREVDQRPADLAVAADVGEALAELAEDRLDRLATRSSRGPVSGSTCGPTGGADGSDHAEDRGDEVHHRDDEDQRLRPGDLDDERAEEREADRERGVERQREDARSRRAAACFGTSFGIIDASAGPKNTVTVETKMFSR